MFLSHRPKSLLSVFTSISSFSPLNAAWMSHFSTKSLQNHSEAKPHFTSFFNSMRIQETNSKTNKLDRELELVSALKSCSSVKAIFQGQQIHALVTKTGLDSNIFIQNSLLSMYAKCDELGIAKMLFCSCSRLDSVSCNIMMGAYVRSGKLDDARHMFDVMPEKGCVAYTTMIMGLAQNDRWSGAIEVFRDMTFAGVVPNEVTMASVISSYAHVGGISDAGSIHGLTVKLGLTDFVLVSTNLLHMYCVCSSIGNARRLFNEMPEKNVVSWNVMLNGYSKQRLVDLARDLFDKIPEKDVVSWGTIVDAYVQVDRLSDALMMYRAMLCVKMSPNDVMIVDLVSACGKVMAICEGQQLHATIVKTGFDCYDFIQSTIVHFYSACQKINLACKQFDVAHKNHLASWNALISVSLETE